MEEFLEKRSKKVKIRASERTKMALATVLRQLMDEKEFSKITISDIVGRAGVNRKTFYYHFRSTDALLAWMIENETLETITDIDLDKERDLRRRISLILDYLENNRELFHQVNHSVGRGAVHKFIYRNLYPIVLSFVTQIDLNDELNEGFRAFVSEFYTEAIAGVLQNWIEKPILRDRNEITEYTLRLVKNVSAQLGI